MRYVKGSITLNQVHDVPLLQQVLRCGFVTHEQLWRFTVQDMIERRRDAFSRRLKRLVDHGFLNRSAVAGQGRSFVYSLTRDGASELLSFEPGCPGASAFCLHTQDHSRILHALELNEIRLALTRSGLLRRWMSEAEIRSRNELTDSGYEKDYDAIVTLRNGNGEVQLALEYERQAKGERRYKAIAAAIQCERRVDLFLYLIPEYELLLFVRRYFERIRRRVYFAICRDFKRDLMETHVFDAQLNSASLLTALQQ
jgi:DNA-binding MarR family transcriptional regulator